MIGFRGCRIQICYLNFSGSKERYYGNQVGKNKPKIAQISVLYKTLRIFLAGRVLGVSEFTYIIGIFKGLKRVNMATEFNQTSAKIALISVLYKKTRKVNCEY